jgi:palmitoyltransferase
MFSVSVFSLLCYHIYLVARNCTTLESFRTPIFHASGQPDPNGFNLTFVENFKQIFGNNFFSAILPIRTQ